MRKQDAAKELLRRRKIKEFKENIKKYNQLNNYQKEDLIKFIKEKSKETINIHEDDYKDLFIKGQLNILYDISCYINKILNEDK